MPAQRTRRGRGEGSVYQQKDGRWVVAVSLGVDPKTKRRQRLKLYGHKKTEVVAQLARLRTQGTAKASGELPERMDDFLDRWLEESVQPNNAPSTYIGNVAIVRTHLKPRIGSLALATFTACDAEQTYRRMAAEGAGANVVRNAHAVLRKACAYAVRTGVLSVNPLAGVPWPRYTPRRIAPLDRKGVAKLLQAARGDRYEALYVLAVTTGMRQGELFALRWSDVDFAKRRISVRGSVRKAPGRSAEIAETKTRSSRRAIALSPFALEALERHRTDFPSEGDLIFCNGAGKPISRADFFARDWRRVRDRAGLSIRFRDLRHTAATLLLADNAHPKIVAELLGHASVRTTLDTYSHVLPSMHSKAVERLGSQLQALSSALKWPK